MSVPEREGGQGQEDAHAQLDLHTPFLT